MRLPDRFGRHALSIWMNSWWRVMHHLYRGHLDIYPVYCFEVSAFCSFLVLILYHWCLDCISIFKDTYDHWFAGGIGTWGGLHLSRSDFEWCHFQVRGVVHAWHLVKPLLHAHHFPVTITTGKPPTHYVLLGPWDLLFRMFSLHFISMSKCQTHSKSMI